MFISSDCEEMWHVKCHLGVTRELGHKIVWLTNKQSLSIAFYVHGLETYLTLENMGQLL